MYVGAATGTGAGRGNMAGDAYGPGAAKVGANCGVKYCGANVGAGTA
jgi:hypothetical protein